MASAVDRLEPPIDPLRRRTGKVQHVPIEFTPAFNSGTGSSGGSGGSGDGKGFDPESIGDFAKETWKGPGGGDPKQKGWLW